MTDEEIDFQLEMQHDAYMDQRGQLYDEAISRGFESIEDMEEYDEMRHDDYLASLGNY